MSKLINSAEILKIMNLIKIYFSSSLKIAKGLDLIVDTADISQEYAQFCIDNKINDRSSLGAINRHTLVRV